MRTIYAIAMTAAVLMSGNANADSVTSTNCRRSFYTGTTCSTTTVDTSSSATPRQTSAAEERKNWEDKQERIRKWEAFCKPTRVTDKEGITRMKYAQEGCEFGRSEDGGT